MTDIITAEIKSANYDNTPKDRYRIVYSYPKTQISIIIRNAINDSLHITTGESSFISEIPSTGRNGISFILLSNEEIFLDSSISPPTLTFDSVPVVLTESVTTFTGTFTNESLDYEVTYETVSKVMVIEITSGGNIVNIITIDEISGSVTVN